jgi:LacI family transcriptional regulator
VVERVDRLAAGWLSEARASIETLRPAGVVLTPPVCDWPELTDLLTELDVPFVRIAPSREDVSSPIVTMDDYAAARDMTAHLIGLGHRDIAFVEGIRSHGSAEKRLAGFRQAMVEAGLPVRGDWICEGDFTFRAGFAAVAGFDDAPISRMAWPQLTTVRQPNDEMAAAAVDILVDPRHDRNASSVVAKELGYDLIIRQSTGSKS